MTFKITVKNILKDCKRFNSYIDLPEKMTLLRYISILLRPEVTALLLYRLSHFFYKKHVYLLAFLFYRLNLLLTGSDINPVSEIDHSCLIVHTVGTVIFAKIGKNATLYAHISIGADCPKHNVKFAPVIGDNVIFGSMVIISGSIHIADNVSIAAGSIIDSSIMEEDSVVRRLNGDSEMKVVKKNPKIFQDT